MARWNPRSASSRKPARKSRTLIGTRSTSFVSRSGSVRQISAEMSAAATKTQGSHPGSRSTDDTGVPAAISGDPAQTKLPVDHSGHKTEEGECDRAEGRHDGPRVEPQSRH